MHPIWERLGKEIVIFDGPTGTMLSSADPETLVLSETGRGRLRALYRQYLDAGAEVITTDTFAANAMAIPDAAVRAEIVHLAVGLARECAGSAASVAASVGPLDLIGEISPAEIERIYGDQVGVLVREKPDLLLLETFAAPREARPAIDAAGSSGVPFIFSLNANRFASRAARNQAVTLANYAVDAGARAIGLNCAAPFLVTDTLEVLLREIDVPLLVYPNAGTPAVNRGQVRYNLPLDALAAEVEYWYNSGVAAFGGCCGTTPEHIALLAKRWRGRPVLPRRSDGAGVAPVPAIMPEIPANPLREAVRSRTKRIAVELRFPADSDPAPALALARELAADERVFFTVPDCPTGNPGCDPLAAAALIRQAAGAAAEVVIHQAASNANLSKLYANMFGAWELGVHGILAVSGDPPALGPFNRLSHRTTDVSDAGAMLKMLTLLGEGWLLNDQALKRAQPFVRACAYGPGHNPESAAQWLQRKIAAGAEAVFTQPIFGLDQLEELERRIAFVDGKTTALFVGIMPLGSVKTAQRLRRGLIPGVTVPDGIVTTLEAAGPDHAVAAGMEHACELARIILEHGHNLYIIPPFLKDKYRLTAGLIRSLA